MPTESSDVYQEIQDMPKESLYVYRQIQDIIESYSSGMPMSCLEMRYEQEFKRPLDYKSLGVETIEELLVNMCDESYVLLCKNSESKETYAVNTRLVETGQKVNSKPNVQESLNKRVGEIPLSSFEGGIYKESSEIQDMLPMKSSDVYQKILDTLAIYYHGTPVSCLPLLEIRYVRMFRRPLDYKSLGLKTIEELILKMRDKHMVVLVEEPESKETYVMCARSVESRQKVLKRDVQELLDGHGGEIQLSSFEREYKDKFQLKLSYHRYGLTGLDHLCEVLNLVVEEANSPGEKVIKAGKMYNLRKRKK